MSDTKDNLFRNNLALLASRSAGGSIHELIHNPLPRSIVSTEPGDPPTFHVIRDDARILLHSRRDPVGEARRQVNIWIEKHHPDPSGMIVLVGAGACYHVEALSEFINADGAIFVAEPKPDVLLEVIRHRDLSFLNHFTGNLFFSVATNLDVIASEFRARLNERLKLDAWVFIPPFAARAFPKESQSLERKTHAQIHSLGMNRCTIARLAGEWQQNALTNLPLALSVPLINEISDLFPEWTGLVVAAGPSLDAAMPHLKSIADDCLVIAVGHALKPLLAAGIEPELTVSVDGDVAIAEQHRDVKLAHGHLLLPAIVHPTVMGHFADRTFLFSTHALPGFEEFAARLRTPPDSLAVGGTVVVTAIDAAIHCGCATILFAGLDLSFHEDGTTHALQTIHEDGAPQDRRMVRIAGNYGRTVWTNRQFANYVGSVNAYLRKMKGTGRRFINVNDAGALLENVELIHPAKVADVVSPKPTLNVAKSDMIGDRWRGADRSLRTDLENMIKQTVEELEEMAANADKALKACEILMNSNENSKFSDKLIKELDRLDGLFKRKNNAFLLISGAIEPVIMNMYDRLKASSRRNERNESIKASAVLYDNVKQVASWMAGAIENSLADYRTINQHAE